KYATEVLERASMLTCNPCRTPVDTDSKLAAAGDPDPTLYRRLAGALPLHGLTSLMPFSKFVSLCMILESLISLLSSGSCDISVVH
ncbi:ribonuclease H-like domain-containing protein, partial [Tanacetum coccineum]